MTDPMSLIFLIHWLLITRKLVKAGREFTAHVHRRMKSQSNCPEPLFRLEGGIPCLDRFSGLFPIILHP